MLTKHQLRRPFSKKRFLRNLNENFSDNFAGNFPDNFDTDIDDSFKISPVDRETPIENTESTPESNSPDTFKTVENRDRADFANKIVQNFNVTHVTKHQEMTTTDSSDSMTEMDGQTHDDIDTHDLESNSHDLDTHETFSEFGQTKFRCFEKLEIENQCLRAKIKEQAEMIAQMQIKLAAIRYIVN